MSATLTPRMMAKKATLMRARNECSIARAYIANELLPQVEKAFDALPEGEEADFVIPEITSFIKDYVEMVLVSNQKELTSGSSV